jgi:hypothetical protein
MLTTRSEAAPAPQAVACIKLDACRLLSERRATHLSGHRGTLPDHRCAIIESCLNHCIDGSIGWAPPSQPA